MCHHSPEEYKELLEKTRKQAETEARQNGLIVELRKINAKLLAERNRLFRKVADIMEICSDD